eukprot:CAMPEP_0171843552 /NCGR_PEP_ID=MMETSP0992-20121227/15934_1 /TAXON_ID=483369 /ORGANISM="non described non described, Strain CCMP2098" /LENGTH=55 /DNA_ID=CAMNT_0012461163 /DNA_START=326 /DNA_END=489 /DNA_ORIENTATION=+
MHTPCRHLGVDVLVAAIDRDGGEPKSPTATWTKSASVTKIKKQHAVGAGEGPAPG